MESLPGVEAFAALFDRATGDRLDAAERFVRSLPHLFTGELVGCDLAYRAPRQILVVLLRFSAARFDAAARSRLDFWCGRAGVRCAALEKLPASQRTAFFSNLKKCDATKLGLTPDRLLEESASFFTEAGASPHRKCPEAGPVLLMDVGGPNWAGVRFDPATLSLFVPGQLAPPQGDQLALALRFPALPRPLEVKGRVIDVHSPGDPARGTAPTGFTLELEEPSQALLEALTSSRTRSASPGAEQRAHQRFAVKAPVLVMPAPDPGTPAPALPPAPDLLEPPAPFPTARIEYATDQELAADFVENLSQGGAFVRTSRPSAVGTHLVLSMRLPSGEEMSGRAVVVTMNENGMGVKFDLPPEGEQQLAAAIARISARPRRALVVDDDELVRRMLKDALEQRGFEVMTAPDGEAGLAMLMDELLALDLLVTDVRMPNMDGQAFLRTIRRSGGESELAIVVVTGLVEPGLEKRLEHDGADAVLDKELGPELIAQAADAVLERKRLERGT
ncbi:MAG TPA: response regulator [Anaeromyxobacteraceae bacterium]|nr:response regulator [Anaeromyxobacteraceae bacterium]